MVFLLLGKPIENHLLLLKFPGFPSSFLLKVSAKVLAVQKPATAVTLKIIRKLTRIIFSPL
jgi:hypothetical protein